MNSIPFWLVILIVPMLAFFSESTVSSNVYSDSSYLLQSLEDETGIVVGAKQGHVPMQVSFALGLANVGEDEFVRYSWNFGDGEIADGKDVTHLYSSPGEYRVSLTVLDQNAAKVVFSSMVTVDNLPTAKLLELGKL